MYEKQKMEQVREQENIERHQPLVLKWGHSEASECPYQKLNQMTSQSQSSRFLSSIVILT